MRARFNQIIASSTLLRVAAALPFQNNDGSLLSPLNALQRRDAGQNTSSTHINDATGYQGAAACVSVPPSVGGASWKILIAPSKYQEVGLCSEIGIDTLRKGGNAADGAS